MDIIWHTNLTLSKVLNSNQNQNLINYYSIWIFNIHISHLRLLTMIIASSKWQYIHIFANFTCIESKRSPIWSLLLKLKPIMNFIKNDFMYWLQPLHSSQKKLHILFGAYPKIISSNTEVSTRMVLMMDSIESKVWDDD